MTPRTYNGDERRRNPRAVDPVIRITIKAGTFDAFNWSLGGALLDGYFGSLGPGSLLEILSIGPVDGEPSPVLIRARVLRSGSGQLALGFLEIDKSAYTVLNALMEKPS